MYLQCGCVEDSLPVYLCDFSTVPIKQSINCCFCFIAGNVNVPANLIRVCNACQKLPLVWSLKGTYNNSTIYFFTCSFISLDRSDHDYVGGSTLPWHLYTLQLLWSSPFVEFWHDGMNHSLMKTKLQSRTDQRKLKFPYSIENRQNNNITLESHLLKFLHTSVTFFPRTFPGPFKNISAIFKEFFPSESNKNVSVTGGGGNTKYRILKPKLNLGMIPYTSHIVNSIFLFFFPR